MQPDFPQGLIHFYATAPYPCSYLPGRQARSQVAAPPHIIDGPVYSDLVRQGFRRSGVYAYRPHCDACSACVPVRIPVNEFVPNRAQRRALKQHQDLTVVECPLEFDDEHYALYQHYQSSRHAGGGMDEDSREQYSQFLLQSYVDSHLIEFRDHGELCMVSLIDRLTDGLSSVYTFYDTRRQQSSFGTYGILWQIETCRYLDLPYLYLGYWISESPKMTYKRRFQPLEGRIDGQWTRLADSVTVSSSISPAAKICGDASTR